VTKKWSRYEVVEKEKIIHELDKNLYKKGPNIGKPNSIDGESSDEEHEDEDTIEAIASNKENEQILDLKKLKRKVQRDAEDQRILTSSNANNSF